MARTLYIAERIWIFRLLSGRDCGELRSRARDEFLSCIVGGIVKVTEFSVARFDGAPSYTVTDRIDEDKLHCRDCNFTSYPLGYFY